MAEYGPATYGDRIASVYDAWVEPIVGATTRAAVDFLADWAQGGPALVQGIDASAAMVERLRAKAGGAEIDVALGDFSEVEVEGSFRLVYVVFNTLFALLDQEAQVRCFRTV